MGLPGMRPIALVRHASLVAAMAVGVALLTGLGGPWGWVLAFVSGGLLAAITVPRPGRAALAAALAGLLGSVFAVLAYRAPRAVFALDTWHAGYPPSQVNAEFLGPLIRSSAVNGQWGRADVGLVLAITGCAALCAVLVSWLLSRVPADRVETARAAAGALVVVVVCIALVAGASSGAFRVRSTHPLPAGSYRFDAAIYMNAYFNLLAGMPYYQGLVKAASGDARLIAERDVRNGKFYGWAYSPAFIRMPWTFEIWRVLAPSGGLFYVSVALCCLALFAVYWGLYPLLTVRAALVPPIVFPLLMACTGWLNLYFPDWWAGLAILFSVALLVRERYVAAVLFAFLAGIFRDVALVWIVILTVYAVIRALRDGGVWRARAGIGAGLIAVFFALYAWHYRQAAPYCVPVPGTINVWGRLAISAAGGFAGRFIAPAAYMMAPYGSLLGKHAIVLLAQLPGWWLLLRRRPDALWPVLGFAAFWIAFTATIGATSSYWGQMYTPVAVVGSAVLFAWAAPETEQGMIRGVKSSQFEADTEGRSDEARQVV